VDYHLALTIVVGGTVSVFVNGAQVGPTTAVAVATPNVSDTVLIEADAGDTVQLMYTPTAGLAPITLGSSSIAIQQVTAN
jgi:hypothetical protein